MERLRSLGRINADTNDLRTILLSFLGSTSEIIALWQLQKLIIRHEIPVIISLQLTIVGTFITGIIVSELQRSIRLKKEVSVVYLPVRSLFKLLRLALTFICLPYLSPLQIINLQFIKIIFRLLLASITNPKYRGKITSFAPWFSLVVGLCLVVLCPSPTYPTHFFRTFLTPNLDSESLLTSFMALLLFLLSLFFSTLKHGGRLEMNSSQSPAHQVVSTMKMSHWFQYLFCLMYLAPIYLLLFLLEKESASFPGTILTVKVVLYGVLYLGIPSICNLIKNVLARTNTQTMSLPTSSPSLMLGEADGNPFYNSSNINLLSSPPSNRVDQKIPRLEYRMIFCFVVSHFFMFKFTNVFFLVGYGFIFFSVLEFENGMISRKLSRGDGVGEDSFSNINGVSGTRNMNIFQIPFYYIGLVISGCQLQSLNFLRTVFSQKESRDLFLFLLLNVFFMLVEFFYGFYTNSLGLIADSVHMMFDCSALSVGLYGTIMKKWPPNKEYTYGYGRYETMSAFVNGGLLVFTSLFVFCEALERMVDPPEIYTEQLLTVSVLGLIVNLIGVVFFFFQDAASSADTYAVLLHMIADTLGSVGVITSTILIMWKGWLIADPICSFMISFIILFSSYQLISESISILTQVKSRLFKDDSILDEIRRINFEEDRVEIVVEKFRSWCFSSEECVCTIEVLIPKDRNEQIYREKITRLLKEDKGIMHTCVQVRKEL